MTILTVAQPKISENTVYNMLLKEADYRAFCVNLNLQRSHEGTVKHPPVTDCTTGP